MRIISCKCWAATGGTLERYDGLDGHFQGTRGGRRGHPETELSGVTSRQILLCMVERRKRFTRIHLNITSIGGRSCRTSRYRGERLARISPPADCEKTTSTLGTFSWSDPPFFRLPSPVCLASA